MSTSVFLSVCLFVCLSGYSQKFIKFSVHVAYGHGSVILWRRCNMWCTSGFVDDVMFSHKDFWRVVCIPKWWIDHDKHTSNGRNSNRILLNDKDPECSQ